MVGLPTARLAPTENINATAKLVGLAPMGAAFKGPAWPSVK